MYIFVNVMDKKLQTAYDKAEWELAQQRYEKATGRKPKQRPKYVPFERGRVNAAQFHHLIGRFCEWLATVYALEVIQAIEKQTYQKYWEPLTPEYADWKKKHHYDPRIWISTGFLEKQIDAYYSGSKNAWVVGINPRHKYPHTNLQVLQVAKWMEYGTSRMPARPVFGPIQRKISRHIQEYFTRFLNEVEMSRR